MKKISLSIAVVLATFGIAPAQATTPHSIAIIDSSFDSSVIAGNTISVCVMDKVSCDTVTQPRNASQFDAFNHGTVMADIVRANNPTATIILIRASNSTVGNVNGIGFERALNWIQENRAALNIRTVSFSYNAGNGSTCLPTSPGVNVRTLHTEIVSDVQRLLSVGTTVFAAAGNHSSRENHLAYPACISEVVSVGSSMFSTTRRLADVSVDAPAYSSPVLTAVNSSNFVANRIGLGFPNAVRVGNTTSVATAIIAAKN